MFYRRSQFKFTDKANEYIKSMFLDLFKEKFNHDLYRKIPKDFLLTPPGKELRSYFNKIGTKINEVQAFVSNSDEWFRGNPHMDLTPGLNAQIIHTRFNILILGNSQDKMYWWSSVDSIGQLEIKEFPYFGNTKYKSYGVRGETIDERWNNLGEPTCSISNLLMPSAFVKTNCVHTVNVSPSKRLILTIPIDSTLEDISSSI